MLSEILCIGFLLDIHFQIEEVPFCSQFEECLYDEGVWRFVRSLSASVEVTVVLSIVLLVPCVMLTHCGC